MVVLCIQRTPSSKLPALVRDVRAVCVVSSLQAPERDLSNCNITMTVASAIRNISRLVQNLSSWAQQ